ncbi:hypothetical protein [Thermodesulfovibrio sp. 3462-1]|uniref:Uncharacterized protein n=1 Tax=Thermodesulfovibrio obliviosus TaxID=3118332 RepID=A0AAU8H164_9BACT
MNEKLDKWKIMWNDIFYTFFSWQILDDIIWMFKNNPNLHSMDLTPIEHIRRFYIEAALMRLRKYLQPSAISLRHGDINLPILLMEKLMEKEKEINNNKEINNLIHVMCGFKEIREFTIKKFIENIIKILEECRTHENIENFIFDIFAPETAKIFKNEIDNFRKSVNDLKEKLKEVIESLENLNRKDLNEKLEEIDGLKQKIENAKKEYQEIIEKRIRLFNSIETHLYERVEKEHPEEVILPENLPENERDAYYKTSLDLCLYKYYPDIKKKLDEIDNNILTNLNTINKSIELICLKLIFGKLWIICDKYIAHPSRESFDISVSISLEEIRNAVEEVIKEAFALIEGGYLVSLTPVYQGRDYLSIFKVPWLPPAYPEK